MAQRVKGNKPGVEKEEILKGKVVLGKKLAGGELRVEVVEKGPVQGDGREGVRSLERGLWFLGG